MCSSYHVHWCHGSEMANIRHKYANIAPYVDTSICCLRHVQLCHVWKRKDDILSWKRINLIQNSYWFTGGRGQHETLPDFIIISEHISGEKRFFVSWRLWYIWWGGRRQGYWAGIYISGIRCKIVIFMFQSDIWQIPTLKTTYLWSWWCKFHANILILKRDMTVQRFYSESSASDDTEIVFMWEQKYLSKLHFLPDHFHIW